MAQYDTIRHNKTRCDMIRLAFNTPGKSEV